MLTQRERSFSPLIPCINNSFDSIGIFLLFFCTISFFIIGFLDDYLSIINKKNTGLKSNEKFILQTLISILFIPLYSACLKFNIVSIVLKSLYWFRS